MPEIDTLDARFAKLELAISDRIVASERALRNLIDSKVDSVRNLVFGTYALIIVAIFINHFWK